MTMPTVDAVEHVALVREALRGIAIPGCRESENTGVACGKCRACLEAYHQIDRTERLAAIEVDDAKATNLLASVCD